jgi:hypothetical protein
LLPSVIREHPIYGGKLYKAWCLHLGANLFPCVDKYFLYCIGGSIPSGNATTPYNVATSPRSRGDIKEQVMDNSKVRDGNRD